MPDRQTSAMTGTPADSLTASTSTSTRTSMPAPPGTRAYIEVTPVRAAGNRRPGSAPTPGCSCPSTCGCGCKSGSACNCGGSCNG